MPGPPTAYATATNKLGLGIEGTPGAAASTLPNNQGSTTIKLASTESSISDPETNSPSVNTSADTESDAQNAVGAETNAAATRFSASLTPSIGSLSKSQVAKPSSTNTDPSATIEAGADSGDPTMFSSARTKETSLTQTSDRVASQTLNALSILSAAQQTYESSPSPSIQSGTITSDSEKQYTASRTTTTAEEASQSPVLPSVVTQGIQTNRESSLVSQETVISLEDSSFTVSALAATDPYQVGSQTIEAGWTGIVNDQTTDYKTSELIIADAAATTTIAFDPRTSINLATNGIAVVEVCWHKYGGI